MIAPLLIILRVAQGRALTRKDIDDTLRTISGNKEGAGMQFGTVVRTTHTSSSASASAGTLSGGIQIHAQDGQSVEMLAFKTKGSHSVHEVTVV